MSIAPAQAVGGIAAANLTAPRPCPAAGIASRDGWAVASRETVGATPYAPVYLDRQLDPIRTGDTLPEGCDAVLPPQALSVGPLGSEILQAVAPGADMQEAGDDFAVGATIVSAGQPLGAHHVALLQLAGVDSVSLRSPELSLESATAHPLAFLITTLAVAAGARIVASPDADIAIVFCEPGHAGSTSVLREIAAAGTLLAHGLAVHPGETIGLLTRARPRGGVCPVFVLPARFDDTMAAWLLLIAPCLAVLTGASRPPRRATLPLTRKIASAPGLADLVLLRRVDVDTTASWAPVAVGTLPWSAFSQAEAFCLVPPESEGVPAGAFLEATLL